MSATRQVSNSASRAVRLALPGENTPSLQHTHPPSFEAPSLESISVHVDAKAIDELSHLIVEARSEGFGPGMRADVAAAKEREARPAETDA